MLVVILLWPRKPGFSSTSTRRSASLAVMRAPASIMAARMVSKRQAAGRQGLMGSGVTRLASEVQSGVRLSWPMRS